jgi:hypothetical protein
LVGYIYKITNTVNNHIYIGKHQFDKPYIDKNYKGSGSALLEAYKKYGIDNFEMIVSMIAAEVLKKLPEDTSGCTKKIMIIYLKEQWKYD